ncbi:hypothetical protein KQH82_00720 [bacterium]|nr:hypothetical protein [bacterium]
MGVSRSIVVVAVISGLVLGCSSGALIHTASRVDEAYTFTKSEPIIVALPDRPTEDDELFVDNIEVGFSDAGFTLVDDVAEASRILTFRFSKEGTANAWHEKTVHTGSIRTSWGDIERYQPQKVTWTDSGLTLIYAQMIDITDRQRSEMPVIWEAWISVKRDEYEKQPALAMKFLTDLYGKNEVRDLKFKPPFQSKDKKKKQN